MNSRIAALGTILLVTGISLALAQRSITYNELQITDQHRFQENVMSGHWGHHLGHLVRAATTGLWFADDTGNDVYFNPRARYYQLVGDSTWVFRASIDLPGQVQQNTASVAVGDTIFTYGIDIAGRKLVEAWLDTRTLATGTAQIKTLAANTNYIGAAVSPAGSRVVWWTNVVDGGGPCTWFYTFHDGAGWSPVIESRLAGANDFSYVFVTFADDTTFYAAGEAIDGLAPNWTYELAAGMVVLGEPIAEFTKLPGDNYGACDIWHNPRTGDLHLLGNGQHADVTYYRKPRSGAWPDSAITLANPATIYRGTRFIDAPDGYLYIILSTPTGLKFKRIRDNEIAGDIPFDDLSTHDIHNNPGFNFVFAVFPESARFQTAPVRGIHFAYPGNDYEFSHIVRHVEILPDGATEVSRPIPDVAPTHFHLSPNFPNPFSEDTEMAFELSRRATVVIWIYNSKGQVVRKLVDSAARKGVYRVRWDGRDERGREMPSGIYLVRVRAGKKDAVRKVAILR